MSEPTPRPWRAGFGDGSDPTTVMTVVTRQKTSKVGIRVESGKTKRGKFVSLTRDETAKPLNFGPMTDIICEMADEDLPEAEQVANAAFIVRACNSHDEMVAALEKARTDEHEIYTHSSGDVHDSECELCAVIDVALAKAKP